MRGELDQAGGHNLGGRESEEQVEISRTPVGAEHDRVEREADAKERGGG